MHMHMDHEYEYVYESGYNESPYKLGSNIFELKLKQIL